jgi:hypothetical protein
LVVFEAFFAAGLRLPAHRFVGEVLRRFNVQVHQLTPNAVVALAKYVWATTSYGGQPSVEVSAKYYCLHWQKRKIGNKIAQFGSCTFMPKTGKTSMEVVELVPCARNKWGNWWDFWFYVAEGTVEDHPGLPMAEMCSHCYSAYPQFEVAEEDADEGAMRCAAGLSSGRDLVEEFVAYGVWPLARGWALGEVCPRQMPSRGGMLVRSPAFAMDLHSRDPAAFMREAEDGAVRIVGRYVPRTEGQRSWDIRGSNDRLNRVFELNHLPYGGYPGQDDVDRRGKKPAAETGDDPAPAAAPSSKKRKLGTCRRSETGGVPEPTSECRRVPQPRWVEREGEREGGKARRPETSVREVGIPRPSCSSRAQVGCACSRGVTSVHAGEGASGFKRAPVSSSSPRGQPSLRGPWSFLL